jgi:two-component system response regulator DesR
LEIADAAPRAASRRGSVLGDWQASPRRGSPISPAGPAVTLALIGGQRLLRDATASLLTAQDGLHVLGAFESASQFLTSGVKRAPAVLLLDCDGADAQLWRGAVGDLSHPAAEWKLALLCRTLSDELIRCAVEHRVSGVLLKSYPTSEVGAAIAYIASGRTVMPAGWQRAISLVGRGPLELSPRHREILALIAEGRCNEEIAKKLKLSPNTVKFHVRALYSRLGVHNRVEAANRYAQMPDGRA